MSYRRYKNKSDRAYFKQHGYRVPIVEIEPLIKTNTDYALYYLRLFKRWRALYWRRFASFISDIFLWLAIGSLVALAAWCFVLTMRGG